MRAERALSSFRAPDEHGAEQRGWDVVQSSYRERERGQHERSYGRAWLAAVLAVGLGALVLSPAGATVGRLIHRALGVPNAAPALSSLPTGGQLLVSEPSRAWIVSRDGSITRVGSWSQASWSPHGLYAAVVRGDRLDAIDPRGRVQWTLVRPEVSDPRWYAPSGYRVAYLSGHQLRVVAGDGTGDHLVANGVAKLAPAWRPAHPYELASLTQRGRVMVDDAGTGRQLWSARVGAGVEQLDWSPTGQQLVVVSRSSVRVFTPGHGSGPTISLPFDTPVIAAAVSPDARTLALVLAGVASGVVTEPLAAHGAGLQRVLAGDGIRQVIWSPDGRWLLISWPAANQWVFVRVVGAPRIDAVSGISQTFTAGSGRSTAGSGTAFPSLDGWCCTAHPASR